MREIKIRAWDGKKMHYPEFFEYGINGWNGKPSISIPLGNGGYITVSDLMEYIGYKDINGKEIYEQDIVEISLDESPYNDDKRFFLVIKDIRNLPSLLISSAVNWIKVVGNTFEHPHLISNIWFNSKEEF